MSRSRVLAATFAAVLLGFIVDLRIQPGGAHVTRDIDDLLQLAAAGAASLAAAIRASRARWRLRSSWVLIAMGTGCWCLGQCVWTYYEVFAGRATPFPSMADVGYLLLPPFALIGVLVRPSRAFQDQGRWRIAVDGVLVAASLFVLSWATSLGTVYRAGGDSRLAAVVSLAYPGSDLVVLTVTVIVVSYARAGSRTGLTWLTSGLIGLAVADSGFAYLTASGHYATGNLIDAGWVGGFLVLALAAVFDHASSEERDIGSDVTPRGALLIPYLPATLALLEGLWQLRATRGTSNIILLFGSMVVVTTLVLRQILILIDNQALVDRVTHQAFHDALTGLANRALFHDRLVHALDLHRRDLRPLALLLIDLDEFKQVNDTLGHPAGDELLIRLSQRLLALARRGDTVARLGGDEFTVLTEDNDNAIDLAGRILSALDVPIRVGGVDIAIRASIGIAVMHPQEPSMTSTEMLKRADVALYAAKRAGKSTLRVYTPTMEHAAAVDAQRVPPSSSRSAS